jgi:magnesium-transporting ATPase (P-type)
MNNNDALLTMLHPWLWLLLIAIVAGLAILLIGVWRRRAASRVNAKAAAHASHASTSWHTMDIEQILAQLDVGRTGLSQAQAQQRLREQGPNRLPEAKPRHPLLRFLTQFHNVLIYVLLSAAAVTLALRHWVDAGVIIGVVMINALIGFLQEGKAENALAAIRDMLSPRAVVLRDGHKLGIASEALVRGDVVPLQAGDKVPADLRLFQCKGLQIEEAALTGESVPVEKTLTALPPATVLADRRNMAYSGTLVTHGQGLGVVVETGTGTEIGRISSLVAGVRQLSTPLLRQMDEFGRWLSLAIVFLALLGFAFGVLLRDYLPSQMFLAAVGLAVAAIPEGLPAIMTITLALGVQRMAARNAIIRRLPAVETLGEVAVICSDKTGTLTRNEMTVRAIDLTKRRLAVSGTGYDVHGSFTCDNAEHAVAADPLLLQALRAALLCNDSELKCNGASWTVTGDPMEAALLIAAAKAGLEPAQENQRYPRTDLIPFESGHRFMATLHHGHAGEAFIVVKGAPEQIFEMCAWQRDDDSDDPLDHALWQQRVESLASRGYRVLAVAEKAAAAHQMELDFASVKGGLSLLGLFGLIDPPRPEAIAAAEKCLEAGICVKMITGDHCVTAAAIAHQIGICESAEVLSGDDIDALNDEALRHRVEQVHVYARVSPEHKLRLVTAMQAAHMVVAMTGDGVNDAPALKRADVGVAMGGGTEVAKEASEMVLVDDNFASIVDAIEEGRTVYDNIKKSILFILPTNGGEALVILVAILLGFQHFPLTPVQILWVNMITAVTLALALAFEPAENSVMRRPPRNPREPLLSAMLLWRVGFVSLILMSGTFGLFLWETSHGASLEQGRTVAVNTLVAFEIFYLFNSRYITAPILNSRGLFGNRHALLAVGLLALFQLAFTYWQPMQQLFGTADIEALTWLKILLISSSVLFLVEGEKAWLRQRQHRR